MDESLRRLLRDPDTTAQDCVFPLKRSGLTSYWQVASALIDSGKVVGSDHAFQVFVDMGLMTLINAQREVADDRFSNYQYPDNVEVVDTDGWVWFDNGLVERVVFVFYQEDVDALYENAPEGAIIDGPDTEVTFFYVEFEPGFTIIKDHGVHDVRGID